MSGTDYTTTPTLGLFKPNYDMDAEQWGAHLNSNADMLDAYLSPGGNTAFVPIAGGTMTGLLALSGDPTLALQAATKQYADGAVNRAGGPFLPLTGGTVSGATTFTNALSAPTPSIGDNDTSVATTAFVTTAVAAIPTFSMSASGAKGDGVTDDQPVIQAWLDSMSTTYGAAEITLPPGKWYYLHAASLVLPPGFVIRGAYNTKDNQTAGGSLFAAGGFTIDPMLPVGIIMRPTTALRHVKVYRYGMTASASNTQATADYATWAAEGVYKKTNGAVANAATVIPLADTSGITVGMQLTGVNSMVPGIAGTWTPATVTAINPGVSVTISSGMIGALASGVWVRFGASIGVIVARSSAGVTIDDCVVIGFRTGIQTYPGQFSINRCTGDCITNVECVTAGDYATVRDCEWMPLYGMIASTQFVRAGDMVFIHDCGGPGFRNCFGIGWQIGWHVENSTITCIGCSNEVPTNAGPNTENWVVRGGSQVFLSSCHAQGAGTGFHLDGTTRYTVENCSSASSQTVAGNNVAHFLVENTISAPTMYGSIIAPEMLAGYPNKLPIKFGAGTLNACNLVSPLIDDLTAAPTVPFVSGTLPSALSPKFHQGTLFQGNRANGGSTSLLQYSNGIIFESTVNPVTSHTITLPAYPMDAQCFDVWFNVGVTALTWATTDGSAIGNYGNPSAGQRVRAVYNLAQNKWFIGGVSASSFLPLTGGTVTGATTFSSTLAVTGSAALSNGITFGSNVAAGITDFTKHIALFGGQYGVCVTAGQINYGGTATMGHVFNSVSSPTATIGSNGTLKMLSGIGLFNGTPVTTKPTVSGAKGSNAALASLIAALVSYGMVTDSTTA